MREKIFLLTDGRKIGSATYGDDLGTPLFYFHGLMGSRFSPGRFDALASELGIQIISLERPGFGISDSKSKRSLLDWPDDVAEIAEQLHLEKFSVMSLSVGAPYAIACGYKMPKKIEKILIVGGIAPSYKNIHAFDGISFISYMLFVYISQSLFFLYILSFFAMVQVRFLQFPFLYKIFFASKYDRDIINTIYSLTVRNFKECFNKGISGPPTDLFLITKDWHFPLNQVKVDVLLWYGLHDKNIPVKMGKIYAENLPMNHISYFSDEGHIVGLEKFREIFMTLVTKKIVLSD